MPTFNPDTFLNTQVDAPLSTEYVPIPEGEYNAVIEKVDPRTVGQESKPVLDVVWRIDAPEVEDAHEKSVRQTIWLDVTAQGNLDLSKGKNVQLGRLRDAVGQNVPGQAWMPSMLVGNVARIFVKHRMGDEGQIFSDVKGVSKIA